MACPITYGGHNKSFLETKNKVDKQHKSAEFKIHDGSSVGRPIAAVYSGQD